MENKFDDEIEGHCEREVRRETTVLDQGFLDDKIEPLVNATIKKYSNIFQLVFKINEFCYRCVSSITKNKISEDKLYVSTMLGEIHNSYQSSILLIQRGLANDAQILMRSIFEKAFKLVAVSKDEKNLLRAIDDSKAHSNKIYNVIMNKEYMSYLRGKADSFKQNGIYKETSTEDWAKLAGMSELYDSAYRTLSQYTHLDIKILSNNIIKKDDGIILDYNINYKDIKFNILVLIDIMIEVLEAYINVNEFDKLRKELTNIKDEKEALNNDGAFDDSPLDTAENSRIVIMN